MIPLRYVEFSDRENAQPPKRGVPMAVERAIILVLLDQEASFFPIDIARIAYDFNPTEQTDENHRRAIANYRRGYSELAQSGGYGTNPQLSGADWSQLVRASKVAIVRVMDELRIKMIAHPGVVFALSEGQIVPHPNQELDLQPLRPRERRYRRRDAQESFAPPAPVITKEVLIPAVSAHTTEPSVIVTSTPAMSAPRHALRQSALLAGVFGLLLWGGWVMLDLGMNAKSDVVKTMPREVQKAFGNKEYVIYSSGSGLDSEPNSVKQFVVEHISPIKVNMIHEGDDPGSQPTKEELQVFEIKLQKEGDLTFILPESDEAGVEGVK